MLKTPTMHIKRKSRVGPLPIDLEDIKAFLRVEHNYDNKLISDLISMATDYAEWYMERSLISQVWHLSCEGCTSKRIYLSYGPVQNIVSVEKVICNEQKKESIRYCFNDIGEYIKFYNQPCYFQTIDIIYEAGYDNIPEQVKSGIMQHVAAVYRSREEASSYLPGIKKIYIPFCNPKVIL